MMQTPSSVVEGTKDVASVAGEITFRNVTFRYIN